MSSRRNDNRTCSVPAGVAVTVDAADADLRSAAVALAQELNLPFTEDTGALDREFDLVLGVTSRRLELREFRRKTTGAVFVDFVRGTLGHRLRAGVSRREPLARAVGLRQGAVTVLDATAGLGRDASVLAALDCTVIAVERCAVLGALLRDGLARAEAEGNVTLRDMVGRITLITDDARNVLRRLADGNAPDVIYLDPMYPPTGKTALAKKEMRICRRLVGDDADAGELLEMARGVARRRVVVKRHARAVPLAPRPTIQFSSKLVRYDVYGAAAHSATS